MKNSRRQNIEVNAGSMADIAFLLLIFFLVTAVIPNDKGINRKLPPPCPPNINCNDGKIKQRNILQVKVNDRDELLVENEIINIRELKDITRKFLDNNGEDSCNYCNGLQNLNASENPQKAVISLINDKNTS